MADERTESNAPGAQRAATKHLRLHALAYGVGVVVSFLVALTLSEVSWFFWPAIVWGAFVAFHYMYVKSISIDNRWADHRASEVVVKAYDLGHIEDIQKRHDYTAPPGPSDAKTGDRSAGPPPGSSKIDAG